MKTLEDLYFGNVSGDVKTYKRGGVFATLVAELDEAERALFGELADKREAAELYSLAYSELLCASSKESWKDGFRLGLLLGIEVCDEENRELRDIS